MSRRVLILLILIIIILGGGAFLYFTVLNPPNNNVATNPGGGSPGGGQPAVVETATPTILTPILVAVQELPRGIRIPENGIDVRNWPAASVPTFAVGAEQIKDVVGKIARSTISREEPILTTMLVDDLTLIAKNGSDAGATIPAGLQAIAVPIDRNSSVAFALRDGDYVDVIVSFLFVDVDEEFQSRKPNTLAFTTIRQDGTISIVQGIQGRLEPSSFSQFPLISGPSETQRPRLTTQRTIQSALVVHVGDFALTGNFLGNTPTPLVQPTVASEGEPTKGPPPPTATTAFPDVVTLAVKPQDAVTLAWLIEARVPITLTLRNARDLGAQPSTAVTLRYIVENFGVPQPPKLPYALEPALRSVRQIVGGTLVPFASDTSGLVQSGANNNK